jgi:predicted permease
VESVLLALMGGAAGLLGAMWIDQLLLDLLGDGDALGFQSAPDLRVLGFTLLACMVTGLLFGLAPAYGTLRVDLAPALKEETRALTGGAGARLRRLLVMAQAFVSVLLLIGAGLFVRSLINLRMLDSGFHAENVIAFSIDPSLVGYSARHRQQVFENIVDKLRATPGADAASFAIMRVLEDNWWCDTMTVEGYQPKAADNLRVCHNAASPGYLATLGIPLLAGRDFSRADAASKQKVALVNESFARHYFGNQPAIGRHFGFGTYPGTKTYIEIVGIIKDAKYASLRAPAPPQTIVDYEQMEGSVFQGSVYVKTSLDPRQMYATIRRTVHEVDANLPIYEMRTMHEQVDSILTTERIVASLASAFGLLATILAAVGLYGLMAFNVAARTREIGIRMALGARSGNVTWLVMKEVVWLVGAGALVALPAAWGLTRFVRSQLYDIRPNDPFTIVAAMFVLAVVAAMAGYIPARRAARVDPIEALRYE